MSNLLLAVAEQFKGGVPTTMSGPLGIFICTWHTVEAPYSHNPMTTARYLRSKGADTHLVFNPITGVVVQMLDGNQGARTLRDDDWPLDPTNTWGQRHIQIEVMGYAERPWTNDLTPAGRATLQHIMKWLRGLGVPDRWCNGVRPPVYPGPGVRRIQPTESGHFHHAGWIDNNHGDPGAIADPWVAAEGEAVATPLLKYPARANLGTAQFWRDIEKVIRSEGFEVYCGRSYYDDGRCRPGKHGHGATSLHFEGLALDFGRDYETAISAREKIYVSAKIKMLRDYYGSQMGWVHDRGTNDHEDHGHVQARPNITNGKLWDNTLAGVTMYGDRGQAVTDWQASLKRTGENITVDGSYRLQTFWATRRWQSTRGLMVDGIIGPGSRTEMARHLAQIAAEEIGEGIIDLTEYAVDLAALGYPATVAGVTAFQKARKDAPHHLVVDGKFGPASRAALEADMVSMEDIHREVTTVTLSKADYEVIWGKEADGPVVVSQDEVDRLTFRRMYETLRLVRSLNSTVVAQAKVLEQLAAGQGIDPEVVSEVVRSAVTGSMADLALDVRDALLSEGVADTIADRVTNTIAARMAAPAKNDPA